MAKRTRYSEYHDQYANYRLELDQDGILFMQCHTNGGSLVWDRRAHDQTSEPAKGRISPAICRGASPRS